MAPKKPLPPNQMTLVDMAQVSEGKLLSSEPQPSSADGENSEAKRSRTMAQQVTLRGEPAGHRVLQELAEHSAYMAAPLAEDTTVGVWEPEMLEGTTVSLWAYSQTDAARQNRGMWGVRELFERVLDELRAKFDSGFKLKPVDLDVPPPLSVLAEALEFCSSVAFPVPALPRTSPWI